MYQEILEAFGIKDYDDLKPDEQATLREWVEKVEKSQITLEDVKIGVVNMRMAVESELASHRMGWIQRLWEGDKDTLLKARLRNLIVLETILSRPDRARAALAAYLGKARNLSK